MEPLTEKAQAALDKIEQRIRTQRHESVVIVDAITGALLMIHNGQTNRAQPTGTGLSHMRGNILTHNHPSGSSFSLQDLKTLCRSDLLEIRAAGTHYRQPVTYRARMNPHADISTKTMHIVYQEAATISMRRYEPTKIKTWPTPDETFFAITHDTMQLLSEMLTTNNESALSYERIM
jgi:hypothetical protein